MAIAQHCILGTDGQPVLGTGCVFGYRDEPIDRCPACGHKFARTYALTFSRQRNRMHTMACCMSRVYDVGFSFPRLPGVSPRKPWLSRCNIVDDR